ncbi:hypothetical protein V6Z12_A12G062900 [Gossypium hirsutum]
MHKKGRELGLYRLPNPHQNPKGFRGIQMPRPLTTVEEESPLLTKECIKHAPIYCGPRNTKWWPTSPVAWRSTKDGGSEG